MCENDIDIVTIYILFVYLYIYMGVSKNRGKTPQNGRFFFFGNPKIKIGMSFWGEHTPFSETPIYNDWNDVMIERVYFINYGSRHQLLAPITPTFPCDDSRDSWIGSRGPCEVRMGMGVPRAWESLGVPGRS